MKYVKFDITIMYIETHRKGYILIAAMLDLKKNVACNIEEKDSSSVCSIITSNETDNDSAHSSKKEPLRVGDIMKYFPYMSNDSQTEILQESQII